MGRGEISTDKRAVRRFLLKKLLLWNYEKSFNNAKDALSILHELECVQLDPVAVVERNHHLVLHARNGGYRTEHLEQLIETGKVFEYVANAACIIPMNDYPIFEPIRRRYRLQLQQYTQALKPVMDMIKKRLKDEGPLPSRAFQSSQIVRGYWDNSTPKTKDTTLALNILFDIGEITVHQRKGSEKFFTLMENKIPKQLLDDAKEIEDFKAKEGMVHKYMRAYRVFDFGDTRFGWFKTTALERRQIRDSLINKGIITRLDIEGIKTDYYILTEDREELEVINEMKDLVPASSIKFLPPLDNLLWRRTRLIDLFDFHYKWEIYFPESKREYGAYAMPILYGDSLIGRMNSKLVEKTRLSIKLLQLEDTVEINSTLVRHLKEGLQTLAGFIGAGTIEIEATVPKKLRTELSKTITL